MPWELGDGFMGQDHWVLQACIQITDLLPSAGVKGDAVEPDLICPVA